VDRALPRDTIRSGPERGFATRLLEEDHDIKVQRIEERLEEAVRITGEDRETAVGRWFSFGAGHDPEKMKQGLSGTGRLFRVFSQRVFDMFLELGGEN